MFGRKTSLLIAFAAGALLVVGVSVLYLNRDQKPPASPTALDARSFPIYVPRQASDISYIASDSTFDTESTVLTTTLSLQDGTKIILTQQPTPEVFGDVPQQYSKMLALLNQYKEVKSEFGTIALTRPKELNGGQSAVVNRPGTLIFAKPSRDLTEEEWQTFFAALQEYNST